MAGAAVSPLNTTVDEERGELSVYNIIQYLQGLEPHFIIPKHWALLVRLLGVSANEVHEQAPGLVSRWDNLEDCLDIWLKQEESQSWQKIYDTVNYIMENDKATVVFTVFWPAIESILKELEENIVQLVMDKLEAEEIIPSDCKSNISIKQLFDMLLKFVEASPNQNLQRLYNVLITSREFKCFKKLTSCFKEECHLCELKFIDPEVIVSSIPAVESPVSTEVPLSPMRRSDIDVLIETYNFLKAEIIKDISKRLDDNEINEQKLREWLMDSGEFEEDPPDESDTAINLLRVYIKHVSSVMNTERFKRLCKTFGSSEIEKKIEKFETKRQELCKKLAADKLISKSLEKVEKKGLNTIKFTVDRNVRETKIAQIQDLLYLAFDNCGVFIHVSRVKEGNSFTVTCYAPESMIGLLIYKAQKNLSLLKEKGVIFLRIGYCTLLDHKREYEINTEFIRDSQIEKLTTDNENLRSEVNELLKENEKLLPKDASDEQKPEEEYLKGVNNTELALGDLRNEIEKLTTQNENLQSEIKQLLMILEDNGIDQQTDTATVNQSPDDKIKSNLQEMEFSDTGGKQIVEPEVSPTEIEVLTEIAEHADTGMTQLVPTKTLYSDDGSLPKEPVKMKQPLEVDKNQETVVIKAIEQLGAEKQDHDDYKEKGKSDKDTMMKGILRENEQLKKDEQMMSEKYLKLKDEFEEMQKTLDEKEKEFLEQKKNTATLQDQHTILQDEINEKEKELTEQKRNTATLQDQHTILQDEFNKRVPILSFYHQSDGATANYPPVAMVMTNFNEHKEKNIQWFSPAFYSHRGGYKLCLKMDAQGREGGQRSHLSASVHVMKGEYDDQLEWPLTAEVHLELLNRYMDSNHRAVTLRIDESSTRESRERVLAGVITDSGICASHGISEDRFVPHTDLDTLYLKDDSICIRVDSVKINPTRPLPLLTETPLFTSTQVHEFTLSNFSKLKAKNERWKSKPFYTHENGYKFIMTVHPNGEYTHKGSQIAMFLHLMMGDYDNQLSFPFQGTLYVQLVNQMGDHSHAQFPVKYNRENDPKGKHGARVTRYSTDNIFEGFSVDGWGTASFIRHDLLPRNEYRNTEYLRNDELLFRINKIEINA